MSRIIARMSTADRVEAIKQCLAEERPKSAIAALFDAEIADIRMFIEMNFPSYLAQFDQLPTGNRARPEESPAPARPRKPRGVSGGTSAGTSPGPKPEALEIPLTASERLLVDLIRNRFHYAPEARPFRFLPREIQRQIRQRAVDIMYLR